MNCLRALRLALVLAPAWSGCVGPSGPADPFPKAAPARAEKPALPPFPGEAAAPAKPHSAAYTDGYRAGVLAHLDGTSRPAAAPLPYRLANYWDVGNPSAEDWSDGFRTGSAAARRSGLRGPNAPPQAPAPASVAQQVAAAPNMGGFRPVARAPSVPRSEPPVGVAAATVPATPTAKPAPVAAAPVAPTVVPASAPHAPERQPVVAIERTVPADPAPAVPATVRPPGSEFEPWKPARLHTPSVVRDP